jgi:signal transduction histidine kinase
MGSGKMSEMELSLGSLWGTRSAQALTFARLGGLAATLWATAHKAEPQLPGRAWAVPALMALAVIGWLGWMASRRFGAPPRVTWAFLALLSVAGGALAGYSPFAVAFVAVACLGAGVAFEAGPAIAVGALGFGSVVISALALGGPVPGEVIAEGALAAVAGLMTGASRRQYQARTYQAEQLLAERVRADAERDRAAALAERNRLGREIHDVLAHSLGALSVQLEAAHAVLETSKDQDRARRLVEKAHGLAVEGLEETRRAVHALRDEPVDLAEQVAALAAREGAGLTVLGQPRALSTDAGLAVYRAAQEALTNARKHAPGTEVWVRLDFSPETIVLVVNNGATGTVASSSLAGTGGGFGLRGMRERVELVGGRVRAEPTTSGWTVEIAVPA